MSSVSRRSTSLVQPRLTKAALLLLLLASAAPAQSGGGSDQFGTGGKHVIQGRIYLPSGRPAESRLKVRLDVMGEQSITVLSGVDGAFRFASLKGGSYTVVIEGEGYETARESVYIDQQRSRTFRDPTARVFNLYIHLRPKARPGEPRPGVINAALASVPKPAAELYEKALESVRKGDTKKAVEQLKGALSFHPDFGLAHSELGVLYMKLKQPDKAAAALEAALRLLPEDYAALLTYGRALFDLQRLPEAEEQFRRALRKNPASPSAHFYLGLLLLKRREHDGAEAEFKSAVSAGGDQLALAHYYLGGIYWNKGQYKQAADELETYLRLAPDAPDAARLRETIKEFRKKK